MAKHNSETRNRIIALWRGGMSQEQIARSVRGLIDRTTVQSWIKACRESDKG
jgi:transposase